MADSIRVRAAAKVNLHLRVYKRREDGFHGILSLFQAVSLADTIVIRSLKESDTIEIDGDFDCPIRSTTIYKAALAYRESSGIRTGLSLAIDKRIPAGGGLGGGSSDAAATLMGLNALLGGSLGLAEMAAIGASIGSDVPFFLSSAAAIVSGRGEGVLPIEARDDFSLVIANPGFAMATAEAYALLDQERPDDSNEADLGPEELVDAYSGEIQRWPFSNSFERIVGGSRRPDIPRVKDILYNAGAAFASMSGSGSSVFGVFEGEAGPEKALARLAAAGYVAYASRPLARYPTLD
jgi:4-diphosphocytidyl-2-C-methyl-D-erythritol kinase